ncbi:MAG: helix-turn-helix domain-containing protein, partial [Lewinella sp.]|nr:helix-turn-helix domain-containing protein [Lewinella sp.]
KVLPPWWLTFWAYLAYILVLILLIYSIYRFQLSRQLEKAEAVKLKEVDEIRTKLYTNITHEFRTPLTIILGMADQVVNDPKRMLLEGSEMIKRNGRRLLRLVNQMLDLSKLESGSMPLNSVQADIVAYLHYIFESFHAFAEAKDVSLHFQSGPDELVMDYDPDKLLDVVSNLLSNAIKFTPEGGQVYLQIEEEAVASPPFLKIKVKDTGIGIAEKDLDKIFDRFHQLDATSTRKGEGTGIGLALTRELVKLMGGQITVSSQPKQGTIFTISLPITKAAAVSKQPTEQRLKPTLISPAEALNAIAHQPALEVNRPRLLIIEDNIDLIHYLGSLLKDHYQLTTATNGQEGIDKAIESVPDIIISDVMMPEKDGFAVCATLKQDERTSHIPIILLTAKADVQSRIAGLRRGADAYLAKPFNKEELFVRLQKLMELRRQLQRYYRGEASIQDERLPALEMEDVFLQKVRAGIEARLDDEHFGIVQLAEAVNISRVQLYRKVKALTGHSPSVFMRYVRLEHAKELLLTSGLNIAQIAYEVGFSDPSYFSRSFQEAFGKSPTQFREDRR